MSSTKLQDKTVYTAVSQKVALQVAELIRSKGIIVGIKKNRGGKSWAVKVMDWNANNARDIILKHGASINTPSSSINKGEWQAAHAFRQLPDGRVQILTNPGGRVPSKLIGTMGFTNYLGANKKAQQLYTSAKTVKQGIAKVRALAKSQGIKLRND
jgi:hypothetical protein